MPKAGSITSFGLVAGDFQNIGGVAVGEADLGGDGGRRQAPAMRRHASRGWMAPSTVTSNFVPGFSALCGELLTCQLTGLPIPGDWARVLLAAATGRQTAARASQRGDG